jgi:hypothetical protein
MTITHVSVLAVVVYAAAAVIMRIAIGAFHESCDSVHRAPPRRMSRRVAQLSEHIR